MKRFVIRSVRGMATHGVSSSPIRLEVLGYDSSFITIAVDGKVVRYNNVFLRDACERPGKSIHADSRQKLFTTASIETSLHPTAAPHVTQQGLEVDWFDGEGKIPHRSSYSADFLKKYSTIQARRTDVQLEEPVLWDGAAIREALPRITFSHNEYMHNDHVFATALRNLNKYGLIFVNGVPDQSSSESWFVQSIAERIGYVKRTFYGDLFDVVSKPNAENLAYTNTFLPLHMDLLYYESPPGIQLLHAIQNSTAGGENIFSDSFAAAQTIREKDPQAYFALTTVPVPYHYHSNGEHYYYSRPVVVEDDSAGLSSRFRECNYSPPFQAPFEFGITHPVSLQVEEEVAKAAGVSREVAMMNNSTSAMETGDSYLFKDFLDGFRNFEDLVNDPVNQLEVKLAEGTCVVFDNRRILHSRNEFNFVNGKGERWLKGCYLDRDSFHSRLRMLNEEGA
ncbi:unnamed protein product [Kuraishia capsulata CBS 1993]|uniref:TauD/TfdA-like domain-containing protein n=1 Tax=Kuraishia capsulata CBS 1993 TaxID=1382522 RepID=W6MM14_9ASCO|nr:uncharacterized protein KUCA_T00003552001 [Kuraishia capsulata CBS 1993]CDK27574.1 unnamed protein product [Kuraishia capsulata CBS 1993]